MTMIAEMSLTLTEKGASSVVTVAAASVNSYGPHAADCYVVLATTAQMTMCRGNQAAATPTATDSQLLVSGQQYRVGPCKRGDYISFFSTAGGDVYITPQG